MASTAPAPITFGGRLAPFVLVPARALFDTYRLGLRTLVAAPLLVAVAVVPEAMQHVVEIDLGMFASKAAFQAMGNDSSRMAFGVVKVVGLFAAMLLVARFWTLGSVRAALRVGWARLAVFAGLVGLSTLAGLPFEWAGKQLGAPWSYGVTAASVVVQAVFLLATAAVLLDDRRPMPLTPRALRMLVAERWQAAFLITLCGAAAFMSASWLHGRMHLWALGQADALVWTLMMLDALLVGLLAALTGTAIAVGYGATGRVKTERF